MHEINSMRYLKFISFATIFPSDCYVNNNNGLFVDNENKPFTGIGIVIKNHTYMCYLNGIYIKTFSTKNPTEKDFEQALKEFIFK